MIQPSFGRTGERLVFDGWSDGGAETHDITVSEERPTITANFRRQVALDTGSGSAITVDPPGSDEGYHDLSSTVWLTAERPRWEFISWLGDLSGSENPKSLLMDSPKRVAALFIDWGHYRTGKIVPRKPISLRFGTSSVAARDYWIVVPQGATKLEVHLKTDNRRGAIDLHANYGSPPFTVYRSRRIVRYGSAHSSTGTSGDKSIVITPESSPPLQAGPYFIKVHHRTYTGQAEGTLWGDLTVAEAEIAAKAPHFGIPASLITTREGEVPPPAEDSLHRELTSSERSIDDRFSNVSAMTGSKPVSLMGVTRGGYLRGFGAVFTLQVSLVPMANLGPFRRLTEEDKTRLNLSKR
ncbi:MAG: hypothetical protein OXB98_22125, partial [Bryobacterales bacterium]|nr:hypothetical protein [Bryobacterales bacterium]